MKWLIDLNVVLDVLQKRQPFYAASAAVLSRVADGSVEGFLPSHALTTLFYVIHRHADRDRAEQAVDWLLSGFQIVPSDRDLFQRARALPLNDFEDAVVAASAEAAGCDYIVTRNLVDFTASSVHCIAPVDAVAL